MKQVVIEAFLTTGRGFSPDRVVADVQLNRQFLLACRSKGLTDSDEHLNRCLLNVRKAGHLGRGLTTRRTSFRNAADYEFASEIAIRFLERRDGVTLDQVICSPARAVEFDQVAARICPGYSPLEYRWAALSLRKKRRLSPERFAQVCQPEAVVNCSVDAFDLPAVPIRQGLYIFFTGTNALYVGETTNLRKRLGKHLEHSDNKGLAQWLWSHGTLNLHVEVQVLPQSTPTRVRRALEAELIQSRRPEFNIGGSVSRSPP